MWNDILLRLRALISPRRMDEELHDELQFHIEMQARKNRRHDLDAAEAERRARVQFGSIAGTAEECREQRGISTLEILAKDVRFALRMLRKSRGFTAVAVATLALAIGANAVVFAVLNGVILRPLNVPQPESLYAIEYGNEANGFQSYPDYLDLRDRNRIFDGLAAYTIAQAALDTGDNPSPSWINEVSGNYFDVLGIQPYLGRVFHSSDEHGPNTAPYVVLSHAYWHARFHDDPGVVGRTVDVNKHPFTIVGVAPPDFHGTLLFVSPDFFVPIVNQEQIEGRNLLSVRRNRWVFQTLGHLKAGITPAQAVADLNSIGSYLGNTYPNEAGPTTFTLARPSLYGNFLARPLQRFFAGLMLLAGLILLAACANLGSLFAARAADRSREVALRLALGGTRGRVLRQLFTEAVLISLMGGAVGLGGSMMLLSWLSSGAWNPAPRFPLYLPVSPDANVYGVALLLTLASGFLFGAVPVKQVLRTDPYEIVKSGSIALIGRRITARDALLLVQIAICAVLVTSSMVAVRGLVRSLHSNFGFEPRNAMLMSTVLDMAGYRGEAVPTMQKRMIDAMAMVPGVTSVGLVDWVPLSNGSYHATDIFAEETTDFRPANAVMKSVTYSVSPGYFQAAGTALLAGRDFSWHDDHDSPRVAVVNLNFAHKVFGSAANATGRYFKNRDGARIQIVGIVEDGKYQTLTEDQKPAMFRPILQLPSSLSSMVMRSERDPQQLAAAMRSAMRELDSSLPLLIETWNQNLGLALFPSRVATVTLGVLGVMGAMLSITGIFGMAAYSVSKRMKELGIRLALGAQRKEVLQAALARPFKLLALGSAAGLFFGLLASRVLAFIVYQATPRDPLVLTGVVMAMLLVGLLATWIPAQRALSLDPLVLLREE
jgi:predicted permease